MTAATPARILIVDDTPSIHEDFRKILVNSSPALGGALGDLAAALLGPEPAAAGAAPSGGISFTLDHALQGEDAIPLVRQALAANAPYSLAFVDMRMPPGWDGLQTIRQIWLVDPDIQIVICTAHSDHSWSVISEQLGHTDNLLILKKPFDQIEALQLAHALTAKWRGTRRNREHISTLDRTVATRTRELRAAEELFTQAFNASPLGLALVELASHTVVETNASFCEVLGRDRAALLGRPLRELVPSADPAGWDVPLAELRQGTAVEEMALDYIAPDRTSRHLRASARPVTIDTRSCAVWCFRDVTTHVHLEKQFLQAQKMEAVGQLAAGVAHDFNNLLTVILSYSGFISDDPAISTTHRTYLDQIRAAADRATSLTRQLLLFSRRQISHAAPVNLADTIANLRKLLSRLVPERITLHFQSPTDLPTVVVDEANLEHVIMNLVVNARDAISRSGNISIRAATVDLPAATTQRHPESRPGRFVRISVVDDGAGIPPDVLPRIFEPFYTTKKVGEGTGLGLSTVYGIIRQHQGWIEVDSTPGVGTTFDLYFPAEPERPAAPAEAALPAAAAVTPRGRGQRILLVEDDYPVRLAATALATRAGYHVTAVADGPAAIAAWRAASGRFDLLFTDMVMPQGIDGLDLSRRLCAEAPGLRVLLATGYSDTLYRQTASSEVKHPVLLKPYTFSTLAQALESALSGTPKAG